MNVRWNKPYFFHNFDASSHSLSLTAVIPVVLSVEIHQTLDWNHHNTCKNASFFSTVISNRSVSEHVNSYSVISKYVPKQPLETPASPRC